MIIPPGFGQWTIPFLHESQPREAVITCGFRNDALNDDPGDIGNEIFSRWMESLGQAVDTQVTMGPVRVRINVGGTILVGEGETTDTGNNDALVLPSNSAVLVRKRTGIGGHANRGRFYVPWAVAEGNVNQLGQIAGGTLTDLQTEASDFLVLLQGEDYPPVILHSDVALAPTPVSSFQVDFLIGSQRRRLAR